MSLGIFRRLADRTATRTSGIFARFMSTDGFPGQEDASHAAANQQALSIRKQFANNLSSQISNMGARVTGRSVPVAAGGASRAYMRLNRILSENQVRRELMLRRRYEKPKYKRQRLRQEAHARRFKDEVRNKVRLVMQMTKWGM